MLSFHVKFVQTDRLEMDNSKTICPDLSMRGHKTFSKPVETTGKQRNCSLQAISPFSTVFSKDLYCRHVNTRACLGKG